MNYHGFYIFHSSFRGWIVRIDVSNEWLADSKQDAISQVDEYLARSSRSHAA